MKNFKFLCLLIGLLISFIVFACTKNEKVSFSNLNANNENIDKKQNEATWIMSDDHSKGLSISLKFFVGHTADQCGNSCVKIFGKPAHLDCRGFGNVCNAATVASLYENPIDNELMLILMDDEILGDWETFPLPDRSLYITNPQNNSELWLNMPEQVLTKDSSEMEVIIHNIWFSENPELEND
jgi:hypothetical protein